MSGLKRTGVGLAVCFFYGYAGGERQTYILAWDRPALIAHSTDIKPSYSHIFAPVFVATREHLSQTATIISSLNELYLGILIPAT